MMTIVGRLRRLSKVHNLVIILVNILTASAPNFIPKSSESNQEQINVKVPALGKLWESVPLNRFMMSKERDKFEEDDSIRIIELVKSGHLQIGQQCKVIITDKGVLDFGKFLYLALIYPAAPCRSS
jgi:hypothetical protein